MDSFMDNSIFEQLDNHTKPSEAFIHASQAILQEFIHHTQGVNGVLIATTDGFEVSSVLHHQYDAGKLSAVGCSILALVQALTVEALLKGCRSVILDAENGKVLISDVPNHYQPMIMIVVTKQQVLLGQVIHSMNKAIAHLIALDKQHHQVVASS